MKTTFRYIYVFKHVRAYTFIFTIIYIHMRVYSCFFFYALNFISHLPAHTHTFIYLYLYIHHMHTYLYIICIGYLRFKRYAFIWFYLMPEVRV